MDRAILPRGLTRCGLPRFILWLLPWAALLAAGVWASYLCLARGLNQTNMDNRFAFGLWIFLDLAVIALGAGAFFTGFLIHVLRRRELEDVAAGAVVVGFICYSGAVGILMLDVGQPLRAWFTFWHPNVHSMLTEVTFCITCYLGVLALEYAPIAMRNRGLSRSPAVFAMEHEMHRLTGVLAVVGTFLSFFHQGSLGGLYGVLRGRPFAFREGIAIWPSTFFLFVLSAAAVGPSFVLLTTRLVERLTRKRLTRPDVPARLARISGWMLTVYVLFKAVDTLIWINRTAPASGADPLGFFRWQPFGVGILLSEIVIFGLLPAVMLIRASRAPASPWIVPGALLACAGVVLNRFVMTVQTLSLPTLSFEGFLEYVPSWQEVAAFGGVAGYGVVLYSISYRYFRLFPREGDPARRPAGGGES